jgi:hypothetical protein
MRHVAIGDPQAPIETFRAVLDAHGLLEAGPTGPRVAADARLVVMGDYFDWGAPADRDRAAASGRELLEWLAAHPREQVTLLLGNHDLARIGELAHLGDDAFRRARAEADAAYLDHRPERTLEEFTSATGLPTWELASRDFSTFEAAQRDTVTRLLREGRLDVAFAPAPDLLLTHAGVTRAQLARLGLPDVEAGKPDATEIAAHLTQALRDAVAAWSGGPFVIPGLHEPGDATREGRGMFYHRPEVRHDLGQVGASARAVPGLSRRFDVASLPVGLGQAIGHIRDKKCRTLLGVLEPDDVGEGALHHLQVRGDRVSYARGVPRTFAADAATMIFLDGGMHHVSPARYEVYDLVTRAPAERR